MAMLRGMQCYCHIFAEILETNPSDPFAAPETGYGRILLTIIYLERPERQPSLIMTMKPERQVASELVVCQIAVVKQI
ncbi:predicted protein [Sclerotinia sclerotiorum 1980 UF-70]|uniref:Uncharacterized protein n=1 Tax=Sclerotinia sclerotiorum (strain ATCC 18683 / 1980 / Ss-1) TaxID=665079 RepID=A7ECK8_SCLS1|nr:predicted protein [Sclerotinia sclerotiorum 1980 UF-70]EDO00187.1 predicted protein [Sclerotinia sclerotiorum 1980 UF-70]